MSAAKINNDNENTDLVNQVNDLLFRFPLSMGQREKTCARVGTGHLRCVVTSS